MTTFPMVGRTVRTADLPPAVEEWMGEYWRFDEYDVDEAGFEIVVQPGGRPGSFDAPLASPVRMPGLDLPCRSPEDDVWLIGDTAAGVRLALGPRGSRIEVYGGEEKGQQELLYGALFVALYESLRASGLVPLHASVVSRNGEATALLARSGTGKSSTLVQAIRAGWEPIAEDFAWLDPASLRTYGWDRGVHLWPDARQSFGAELSGWEMRADGKLFIPWEAMGETGPRVARLTRMALLLRDAERPSGWEALPERAAVRALWESLGVPLSAASRTAAANLIPDLLRRVETQQLILGSTPLPL